MAIQFPNNKYAKYPAATFLDNQSKLSLFCRVRFDALNAGTDQFVFRHKNAGDQFSLRKDATSGKIKTTMTAGGSAFVVKEASAAPTLSQAYDVAIVWQKQTASPNGFRLWVDGSEQGTGVSTSSTTNNYDSGGGDLMIGAQNPSSPTQFGICTIEKLLWFNDFLLTQSLIDKLRTGKWWHRIQGLPQPALAYTMLGGDYQAIKDDSRNRRHIASGNIVGPLVNAGNLGDIDLPFPPNEFFPQIGAAAAGSEPNPWVLVTPAGQEILHPSSAFSEGGLTNGTQYQYHIIAVDAGGNESVMSSIVSVTPAVPAVPVSSLQVPWQHAKRFSRFRSSQQG